jgi:hypothetical protein
LHCHKALYVTTIDTPTELVVAAPAAKAKGHRFVKGHACFHKKKPFDARLRSAIEACKHLGFNPLEAAVRVYRDGFITEADGSQTTIPAPTRIKLLREIIAYVFSKSPMAVVGKIEHTHVDLSRIMNNPQLADAAETLSLAMSEQPDEAEPDEPAYLSPNRKHGAGG